MSPKNIISVGKGCFDPSVEPRTLLLRVSDIQGTYTIPYIQSSHDLMISGNTDIKWSSIKLSLTHEGEEGRNMILFPNQPTIEFEGLTAGEYALLVEVYYHGSDACEVFTVERIGIGFIVAAIGDSLTEGYYGQGFMRELDLSAGMFPGNTVSRDGRNFPQYSPTTKEHLPEYNCLKSWMTDLNDQLSQSFEKPVFIANEGWGGYATADYLELMHNDENWQKRMMFLSPNLWLIHLGVNDERGAIPPEKYIENLKQIIQHLIQHHNAATQRIFVAKPSYDYWEGAREILSEYCKVLDEFIPEMSLQQGPDFFAAFASNKEKWYGDDPAHPMEEGFKYMAQLWKEAIIKGLKEGKSKQ